MSGSDTCRSVEEIRQWLLGQIAQRARMPVEKIDPDEPLEVYSMDSINTIEMLGDLEQWLGRRVDPEVMFDCSTVSELSRRLGT
jgi:acyl carrier protein